MRALLRNVGGWTTRHAFACRVTGLAAIVALAASLSVSAEKQNARINRTYPEGVHDGARKWIFWHIDDAVEASVRESRARRGLK
jgi:hypothetical protein